MFSGPDMVEGYKNLLHGWFSKSWSPFGYSSRFTTAPIGVPKQDPNFGNYPHVKRREAVLSKPLPGNLPFL